MAPNYGRYQSIYDEGQNYYDTRGDELTSTLDEIERRQAQARDAMYAEPHRTVGQALAQAIAAAVPALVGGAVGGRTGLGYGLVGGGQAAAQVEKDFSEDEAVNRSLARDEFRDLSSLGLQYQREKGDLGKERTDLGRTLGVELARDEDRRSDNDFKERELGMRERELGARRESKVRVPGPDGTMMDVSPDTIYREQNRNANKKPDKEEESFKKVGEAVRGLHPALGITENTKFDDKTIQKANEIYESNQRVKEVFDKGEKLIKDYGTVTSPLGSQDVVTRAQGLRNEYVAALKGHPLTAHMTQKDYEQLVLPFSLPQTLLKADTNTLTTEKQKAISAFRANRDLMLGGFNSTLANKFQTPILPKPLDSKGRIERSRQAVDYVKQYRYGGTSTAAPAAPASTGWEPEKETAYQKYARERKEAELKAQGQ